MPGVPSDIRDTYGRFDPEAAFFLDWFDEPAGSRVLEVGSHDAPLAAMLAASGFRVTGVDLREYDGPDGRRHEHVVGDFCDLPDEFWRKRRGTYDSAVAVSSLEHFGLGVQTYGDCPRSALYDAIAVRCVWDALKRGGSFYAMVPFGGRFVEHGEHWRVYDWAAVLDRIVQTFRVEWIKLAIVEAFKLFDADRPVGGDVTMMDVFNIVEGQPYVAIFLKMRKPA